MRAVLPRVSAQLRRIAATGLRRFSVAMTGAISITRSPQ